MRTIRKKLTQEQKDQGIVLTSCLSTCTTEQEGDTVHEAHKNPDGSWDWETIDRLLDVSFFEGSHFKYHIIRQ